MKPLHWLAWLCACAALISAQCLEYFCTQHELAYFVIITAALAALVLYAGVMCMTLEDMED